MSILNPASVDWQTEVAVREDVLMKTREGQEKLLRIELGELLNRYRGELVSEYAKQRIMNDLSRFGEHVNCKFGTNCQHKVDIDPQSNIIYGFFKYQQYFSTEYKTISFSLQ